MDDQEVEGSPVMRRELRRFPCMSSDLCHIRGSAMPSQLRYLLPYLARYRTAYLLGSACIVASVAQDRLQGRV